MHQAAMSHTYNNDMYHIVAKDKQVMVNEVNNMAKALKSRDRSVVQRQ